MDKLAQMILTIETGTLHLLRAAAAALPPQTKMSFEESEKAEEKKLAHFLINTHQDSRHSLMPFAGSSSSDPWHLKLSEPLPS